MSKIRLTKKEQILSSIVILACFIGLTGCGGSSEVESPRSGKLMGGMIVEKTDSKGNLLKTVPVGEDISGLTYRSGRRVGVTDSDGTFYYKPGETVEFAIDKVVVGRLETSEEESGYAYTKKNASSSEFKYYIPTASTDEDRILLASMRDISAGRKTDFSDSRVVNFIKFLECIDENKNYADGLNISKKSAELVQKVCDSLGISEIDFSTSANIEAIISGLNEISGSDAITLSNDNEKIKKNLFASYSKYKAMPVGLFNIGDGFMAGVQSGLKNIHEATQNRGIARILSDLFDKNSNIMTWQSPKLSMDSARTLTRITGTDSEGNNVVYVPSNVASPAVTCEDIVSGFTGSGNIIADEILKPVYDSSHIAAPVTQLDAAIYSASQDSAKGRLKIFTIWAGMHDVYKNVVPGASTGLDNVTEGLADIETSRSGLTRIITKIKNEYPEARIFIANIPDIDTLAVSLSIEDIAAFVSNSYLNAVEPACLSGIEAGSRVGLNAFINRIAPKLYPGIQAEAVNTALASLSSTEILSSSEQSELRSRSDSINNHIAGLADGERVFLIDVNRLFRDYKNRQFAYIDSKYLVRVPSGGFGENSSDIRYMAPVWGGGFFSSDGYYPSHTGNALIANSFFTVMKNAGIGIDPENIRKPDALTLDHDKDYWYINVEAAWDIDPYRDFDGDGFPGGPGEMPPTDTPLDYIPVSDPLFTIVEDCDDSTTTVNKTNLLPKAVTGSECK